MGEAPLASAWYNDGCSWCIMPKGCMRAPEGVWRMTRLPDYLSDYPKLAPLRDGREVVLRPMHRGDGPALLDMFLRLPVGDRFYLRDDVADPNIVGRWADEVDYQRVLPILALAGERVVADVTLHFSQHPARAHVAEIRYTVDPEFRYQGLGGQLIRELLVLAHRRGVRKVMLELVAIGEDAAIRAAERSGFRQLVRLPEQVQDEQGIPFDLILLERDLTSWEPGA